jgi:hypothetical protein
MRQSKLTVTLALAEDPVEKQNCAEMVGSLPVKGTSLSFRLAPSLGKPLAHAISDCEAKDHSGGNFQHQPQPFWGRSSPP